MALVAICYGILITLVIQMFAVVNQRRYRSAFWMSFVTLLLSSLLCFFAFRYANIKAASGLKVVIESMSDEEAAVMKDGLTRTTWAGLHYLIVLPVLALLQIAFFTKRPTSLFEKKNAVA